MAFGRGKTPPYGQTRTLTASAVRVRLHDKAEVEAMRTRTSGPTNAWQAEAWSYYDAIGEIKYAFSLVAAVLSRIRLYAAVVVDPDSPPVELKDAVTIDRGDAGPDDENDRPDSGVDPRVASDARRYMGELGDVSSMMRQFGLNLSVAGECYLACIDGRWGVHSTDQLRIDASGYPVLRTSVSSGQGTGRRIDQSTPIGRVWRQHPRFSDDPDSSMRSLRGECEELLLLGRMIRATTRSRLNAGLLFVPDALSVAARSVTADPDVEATQEDVFETELIEAMTQPIADEASAASVVPLLVRGPAELGDKIKYMQLSRDTDEQLIARSERLLERILQGLDVPKDIVTGLANVKYSNAVQIDESLYKAHVEPLALMVVDALTDIYLRPLMEVNWPEEADKVVVWYDPSEVVTRPNRAQDANDGYDRYVLNADAWRKAHGFSDSDAPDEAELALRMALEKSTVPPEVAQSLLQHAMPEVLGAAREANLQGGPVPFPDDLAKMLESAPAAEPAAEPA